MRAGHLWKVSMGPDFRRDERMTLGSPAKWVQTKGTDSRPHSQKPDARESARLKALES